MAITVKGCLIQNADIGISTDGSVDVDISDTKIIGCRTAIEHRDNPSVLQILGLPANTPPELLAEALEILLMHQNSQAEKTRGELLRSRLFQSLGNIANATTILANLLSLQQSGLVQSLLSILPK